MQRPGGRGLGGGRRNETGLQEWISQPAKPQPEPAPRQQGPPGVGLRAPGARCGCLRQKPDRTHLRVSRTQRRTYTEWAGRCSQRTQDASWSPRRPRLRCAGICHQASQNQQLQTGRMYYCSRVRGSAGCSPWSGQGQGDRGWSTQRGPGSGLERMVPLCSMWPSSSSSRPPLARSPSRSEPEASGGQGKEAAQWHFVTSVASHWQKQPRF